MVEEKVCTKCGLKKPTSYFSPAGKYFHSRCKPCRSEDAMKIYTTESRRERGIKEHGLTVDRYSEILFSQGGCCAICGKVPEMPYSLFIDHDHKNFFFRRYHI